MAITARTIAYMKRRAEEADREYEMNDMTAHNVMKVTRFREGGERDLESLVERFEGLMREGDGGVEEIKKRRVYPKLEDSR